MNILLINHYAGGPHMGMEYRPHYLAREWVKAGHSVRIVAASFAHTRNHQPETQGTVTREWRDGVDYAWLKTPTYHGNGLGRIRNMLAFVAQLYRRLPALTAGWRPDVVIASSTYPLDYYPARWIARKHGAKVVFEVHDLWPMSPMELGRMSKFHPFIAVMQAAEDAWCRTCDFVVSILPKADLHLATRGLPPGRFAHVPNGINLEEWSHPDTTLPDAHTAYLASKRGTGRFILGYAGAHGVANALDPLVDAMALLKDQPIDLVLVGKGPERNRLMDKAAGLGLRNVTFLNSLPKRTIPHWLAQLDALYVGFQASPLYQFGVSPNKMFDYMMSGRPILCVLNTADSPVQEAGCGVSVTEEDPRAIAAALAHLQAMSPGERQAMGQRGHDYIMNHHTYPVLAARFIQALKQAGC